MSGKYTRAERRQIERLGELVREVTETDRQFFERFPRRRHRVRVASEVEISQIEIVEGKPATVPNGCRVFTAVRNVGPGMRLRAFVYATEGAETDLDEANARSIFEAAAPPQVWEIEDEMRAWQ